jgi:hypothetical protein
MPRYASTGGGSPVSTKNVITNWGQSTCQGAAEPKYATSYPSDRITHRHQAPKGESPKHLDAPLPGRKVSGVHGMYPRGDGKSAAWGREVRAHYGKIDRELARGVPMRDAHARGHSFGSSNAAPQPRNWAFESYGRVKPQGKSG